MSDKKDAYSLEDFIPARVDTLKVNTPIPFDCFVHLTKNDKIIHWLRQGTILSADRFEKFNNLGSAQILILKSQQSKYQTYCANTSVDSSSIFVKSSQNSDQIKNDLTVVKGGQKPDHVYKVFGKLEEPKSEMIFIKGEKPEASTTSTTKISSEAPKPAVKPRLKVDVDFINSLVKATQSVFLESFGIKITFKAPTKRKESPYHFGVASFVGLTSQSIRGSMGLCFPDLTYSYIYKKTTGFECEMLTPEIYTGCAELMHLIFENVRPTLNEIGFFIDRSVPTLVVGENLSLPHIMPDPGFSIIFESPGGPFQFEIGIKSGG